MNRIVPDPFYGAFRPLPDPAFFYEADGHRRALEMMEFAIGTDQAIAVLTGDAGTGKTLLLRTLLSRYHDQIEFGMLGQDGAALVTPLRWVLRAFSQDARDAPPAQLLNRLTDFIASCQRRGRRLMLIADEAQTLSVEELDQLRQLSDIHVDGRTVLPLLLVGQPNLRAVINHPDSRALRSRIGIQLDLPPLTQAETAAYVVHRLERQAELAAIARPEFDPESLVILHEESGGLPRTINNLAQRCLFAARRSGRDRIDADFLRSCLDCDWGGPGRADPPRHGDDIKAPRLAEPAKQEERQTAPAASPDAAVVTGHHADMAAVPRAAVRQAPSGPATAPDAPGPRPAWAGAHRLHSRAIAFLSLGAVAMAALVGLTTQPSTKAADPVPARTPPAPLRAENAAAASFGAVPDQPAPIPPLPPVSEISAPVDPRQLLNAALNVEAVDSAQAAMLFERAALGGNARAGYYLGQSYEAGLGVPADLQRAKAWYRMAQGVSGAEARMRALAEVPEPRDGRATPRPLRQAVFPDGATEIHWRGAEGQNPAGFIVEYQRAGEDAPPQQVQTPLSAMLIRGPVARWRVAAQDAAGRIGEPTAWIRPAPPPR